jgi:hypothetical protein
MTTAETIAIYKMHVASYEHAKDGGQWDDARNAAVKAHQIGASLTDGQRTTAQDEVWYCRTMAEAKTARRRA